MGVQVALKKLKEAVRPVKEIVDAITGSTKRTEKFMKIQERLITDKVLSTQQPLHLVIDVDTRWNSTFAMLQRAELLKMAIEESFNKIPDLSKCKMINWIEPR